jgi:Fic family protein
MDSMFGKVNNMQERAGRYIQQPVGYKAFIPNPLPPLPDLAIDRDMITLLSQADRALGRLDGMAETLPNPDLFVAMYVRKEAVLSSQIEGTQASLEDLLEYEAEAELPNVEDITEVVNYVTAMKYGLERLKTLPLSLRLLKEIHSRLLQGIRGSNRGPGQFRSSQNFIGSSTKASIESATFVPPPPLEMQKALNDMENYFYDTTKMPPLIKAGLLHVQFETIHPFLDGNGRMGRLLITFYLCQQEVIEKPLLYLSHYFKKHRSTYYRLLQNVRDTGDWESWMKFFLSGIYEVATSATDKARKIVQMRENDRKTIITHFGKATGSAMKLFDGLFATPIITVNQAAKITGTAYKNTNMIIAQLEALGILAKSANAERNRLFRYQEYVRILSEDDEDEGEQDIENMATVS